MAHPNQYVRTFYQQNLIAPTFTQTLTRIREEAKQEAASVRAKRLYQAEQRKEQLAVVRLHPRLLRQAQLLSARDRRAYGGARSVLSLTEPRCGQQSRSGKRAHGGSSGAVCGTGTGGGCTAA